MCILWCASQAAPLHYCNLRHASDTERDPVHAEPATRLCMDVQVHMSRLAELDDVKQFLDASISLGSFLSDALLKPYALRADG